MPSSDTWFKKGHPGRPVGAVSGRTKALQILDKVASEKGTLDALEAHLRELAHKNPAAFFIKFIMPLIPRTQRLEVLGDGEVNIKWTPLSDTPRTKVNGDSIEASPVSESDAAGGNGGRRSAPPPTS